MSPCTHNQDIPKVQEPLDEERVHSCVRQNGSPSHPGAPANAMVVEAACQGLMQVLDTAPANVSDEILRDLARMLLPRLRPLLAFLEQYGETEPDAGSPCGSCAEKQGCSAPCKHLEANLNGPYAGKLHDEMTAGVDLEEIRAPGG